MTTIMQLEFLTNNLQGAQERMFNIYDFILIPRRVNITFNVNDVKEIDEERHKVTFDMEIVASWQDTRISCLSCGAPAEEVANPCFEQKSCSVQALACDLDWGSIWKILPQIDRLSAMDVKEVFGQEMILTVLQQENHTVTFFPKADITVGCPMDFSSFPFDRQTCVFEMEILQRDIALNNLGTRLKNSSAEILGYRMQVKYTAIK